MRDEKLYNEIYSLDIIVKYIQSEREKMPKDLLECQYLTQHSYTPPSL